MMLEVSDLRLGFTAGKKLLAAVDGISFAISRGETFALLGESGCGKSATAQGIMRLLPAAGRITGGSIKLESKELLTLTEAEMRQEYLNKISLKRMVTAEDVAAMALFLCSPAARNVTGQAISVDGNVEYL